MGIVDAFKTHFDLAPIGGCAFTLTEYEEGYYTGVDRLGRPVVVVFSATPNMIGQVQESRALKIECNAHVQYSLGGETNSGVVHVLTCLTSDSQNCRFFLELADLLLHESENTVEGVLSAYHALSGFFAESPSLTDNELLGLYGELFAICTLAEKCDLMSFWQSTDRMKYDFSINDRTKIEVKSTQKPQRIHHFQHEQLVAENLDIYIVSYQFQPDDEGTSLYSLIDRCKVLCANDARKMLKLERILKDTGEERLKNLKFNEELGTQSRSIYHSRALPHLIEDCPEGVSSIEYDVDFTNAPRITEDDLLKVISGPQP